MDKNDIVSVLVKNNWETYKDEVGDLVATSKVGSVIVEVIPRLKLRATPSLFMSNSVSTYEFSFATSFINGEPYSFYGLKNGVPFRYTGEDFSSEIFLEALDKIKVWALTVGIAAELKLKRELPTDSPGTGSLLHLASLAINKEIAILEGYHASFKQGDRLGFIPYINIQHILRALKLAKSASISDASVK